MPVTWDCTTEFTIDTRDIIINWRFRGKNCVSDYDIHGEKRLIDDINYFFKFLNSFIKKTIL